MSPLISDLALILIVAGIVTLIFKRLKQPLVLGYIVAGFVAGPHMPYMPTVHETESIEVWSQIGVIFLMFTLGLEFSFKKIVKMGMRPIVAALLVMAFMIGVGNAVGRLFHWSDSDCLFLGGMLAMSSTTIIYKAFDDLGLRTKRFAAEVLSVLILEDMLGILLMVILSASAASAKFEGGALVQSLLSLGFFLILWFVVGVYLIPLFLSRAKRWMSGETLMVFAIGLCFVMVVLADKAGYSSAFGAFMMGSILAETVEAERIEHLVSPVKDLFGAVFFVSVGMLVDPQVLVDYWPAILAITAAIIVGQATLGTSAFVLAGHPLKTAMRCGFSLAQIGEFAFILAALGLSLGVTSQFLYPVVVAVSIVTTFLTPYMIKAAEPTYNAVERRLPALILRRVGEKKKNDDDALRYDNDNGTKRGTGSALREAWHRYLKDILVQTTAYLVLTVAATTLCLNLLLSLCRNVFEHDGVDRTTLIHWVSNGICAAITVFILGLFLRPIAMRKNHSKAAKYIKQHSRTQCLLLYATLAVRFAIAIECLFYVIEYLCPLRYYWNYLIATALMLVIARSRALKYYSIRMQRIFTHNLRRREELARADARRGPAYARRLQAHDVHMQRVAVPARSLWAGRTLADLDFTNRDGVMVAAILRRETNDTDAAYYRQNTPSARAVIYPGDVLEVIGDDASIEAFISRSRTEIAAAADTAADHTLHLQRFVVRADSPFCGKTLAESGISQGYHCMIVGFEDEDGHIETASAQQVIQRHNILWLVGEKQALERIKDALKSAK